VSIPTHVYMLEMSDGILKLGMTGDPARRLTTLRNAARKRCARVTNSAFWKSNDPWQVEEALLIAARMECVKAWGHEYFYGSFDAAPQILSRMAQIITADVTSEYINHTPLSEAEVAARFAGFGRELFALIR
jgi:hypothetical protein